MVQTIGLGRLRRLSPAGHNRRWPPARSPINLWTLHCLIRRTIANVRYLFSILITSSLALFGQTSPAPNITAIGGPGTSLISPASYAFVLGSGFGTQPSLTIAGIDAKVTASSDTFVAFQIPATAAVGPTTIVVRNAGVASNSFPVTISAVSPSLLNNTIINPSTYFFDFTPDFTPIYSEGPGDRVDFYVQGIGPGQPPPTPQVFIDGQQIPVIAIGTANAHFGSPLQSSLTPFTVITIQLPFTLRGGRHALTIQAGGVMSPAVSFSIFANGLIVSQTGLTFNAVEGGPAPPSQTFSVLSGSGTVNFTVATSTVTGSGWLSASPLAGSSVAGQTGTSIKVAANSTVLKAGVNYGTVQVSSGDATNSPQSLSIVLKIAPPATNVGPTLDTTGLVFLSAPGGPNPAPQTVTIFNPTAAALTFTSSLAGISGGNHFTYSPTSGTINSGQSAVLTVQATTLGAAAGVDNVQLNLSFSDGSRRTVNLLLVIAPGVGTSSKTFRDAAGCTPSVLLPVFSLLGDNFNVPAAWPTPIEVTIVDDCGTPMTAGSVNVTFSNADPMLTLTSSRNGKWTTTWPPVNPRSGVTLIATAIQPETRLSGTAKIGGGVQPNPDVPIISHGGIVDTASYGQAPAPGDLIAIFGNKLSPGVASASSLPLNTQLNTTGMLLAGEQLPLIYTSDGQVNAMIPYDVAVNARLQLIAQRSGSLSVPESVPVGVARPAVFTVDASGKGQGHIYTINSSGSQVLADANAPAKPGDVLVVYCAGLGAVSPAIAAGVPAPFTVLTNTVNPVSVFIGGQAVTPLFSGLTPGFTGLYQVNVTVPTGLPDNDFTPFAMSVAGQDSPAVTFSVRKSQ